MKELEEYRANLMKRLEDTASTFREECLRANDAHAPVKPNGWSVHQIAVHTRDVNELVYALRARRTAEEEDPEFPNFDGEAYMMANYNAGESLNTLLDDFLEDIRSFVEWLRALPPKAWSRVSHHTTLGRDLTLQTWVEKDLAHIEEHLKTIRALNAK